MKPAISIVIPVYNRLSTTKEGLSFLNAAIQYYETVGDSKYKIEVVVVDDGSTDGTAQWIRKNHPNFTVLDGNGSLWWTGAVNKGIQYSRVAFENLHGIILQNDDVMLEESWVVHLLKAVENNPNALIGCATTIQEENHLIGYGGRILNSWFARETKLNFKAPRSQFEKGLVVSSFDLYGRGLYIPDEVFDKIGLFNQNKFKHRGDMDIPLRAKKHGYKLLVSYDAVVYELPQFTFGLDVKRKLSLKEAYKLLTDFRSSNNMNFVYQYSRIATTNYLQFIVFFICNLFFHLRGVSWRVLRNYL